MKFFDPHIHCISRTTDDYENMYLAGVRAVVEPSFWLGQPRTSVGTFIDYFSMILEWERERAATFGIEHRCTIGLNPKEANNEKLAEEVLEILPDFLAREGCVAIGELGYDSITDAEDRAFRKQLEMAKEFDLPGMVHTPHRDKARGTQLTIDVVKEFDFDPLSVIIDHSTEETTKMILDAGFWAGHTLYPATKLTKERFANIFFEFGNEHITVNTSGDWGKSDPMLVVKAAAMLEQRGASREAIQKLVWDNPVEFYGENRLKLEKRK